MVFKEWQCVAVAVLWGFLTCGLGPFGSTCVHHGRHRFQLPSLIKALSGWFVVLSL
jgi:hypothetical protein